MNLRNGVRVIVLSVCAIIVVFLFIYLKDYIPSNKYLIIGNYLVWNKKGDKWYQVVDVDKSVTNHKYTVYNELDKTLATSSQFLSNNWYFFNKDYNQVSTDDFRYAYTGIKDISPTSYVIEYYDDSDEKIIREVTGISNNTILNFYKSSLTKVTMDFDSDGVEETIYTFTNFKFDVTNYALYSYLVLVRNGEIIQIKKAKGDDVYKLIEILDIDNDNKNEIIFGKGVINLPTLDSCYQIFKVNKNNLKMTQNCLILK